MIEQEDVDGERLGFLSGVSCTVSVLVSWSAVHVLNAELLVWHDGTCWKTISGSESGDEESDKKKV